jgi:hypothetical protein
MFKIFIYEIRDDKVNILGKFRDFSEDENSLILKNGILDSSFIYKDHTRFVNIAVPLEDGRAEYQNIKVSQSFPNLVISELSVSKKDIETQIFEETTEQFYEAFKAPEPSVKEDILPMETISLY